MSLFSISGARSVIHNGENVSRLSNLSHEFKNKVSFSYETMRKCFSEKVSVSNKMESFIAPTSTVSFSQDKQRTWGWRGIRHVCGTSFTIAQRRLSSFALDINGSRRMEHYHLRDHTNTICNHTRRIASTSSSEERFSSPHDLFQFFYRYKMMCSVKNTDSVSRTSFEKQDGGPYDKKAEVPSREALLHALDRFISWPPSPDIKTPGLVRIACEVAFANGWFQRCCEVFFSSIPRDLLERYEAGCQDEESKSNLGWVPPALTPSGTSPHLWEKTIPDGGTSSEFSTRTNFTKMHGMHRKYPTTSEKQRKQNFAELTMFIDLLSSIPPEVLQSAVHFFQVEESHPKGVGDEAVILRGASNPTLSTDAGKDRASACYSYSSVRYLYQCLVVAHWLASGLSVSSTISSGQGPAGIQRPSSSEYLSSVDLAATMHLGGRSNELEKIAGTGKVVAFRLYFYSLWEIVREEKQKIHHKFLLSHQRCARMQHSSTLSRKETIPSAHTLPPRVPVLETKLDGGGKVESQQYECERLRHQVLRHVAKEAAAIVGIRHHGCNPCSVKGGLKAFLHSWQITGRQHKTSNNAEKEENDEEILEASLRLLRYRLSALSPKKDLALSDSHLLLSDSKRSLPLNNSFSFDSQLSLSERLSSLQDKHILLDALASLSLYLFRLYLHQEGITAVVGQKELVREENQRGNDESFSRFPIRSCPLLHRLTAEKRCSLVVAHMNPEVSSFLLKIVIDSHRWDLGEYMTLLLDQYWYSRFGFAKQKDTKDGPSCLSVTITTSEEDALHQQACYYLSSRQFMRALEWWAWLGSLEGGKNTAARSNQYSADSSTAVAVPLTKRSALAPSFYPVPSVPILATLSRIAGEFATTNDYYVILRSNSSFGGNTSNFFTSTYSHKKNVPETKRGNGRFTDPATLSLWCLETMLHTQQPVPPSGNALFLALTACAKAGLSELEQVLQSLVENQVLSLTDEEILHARLLNCRRDIHWCTRLEALVPLVARIQPLPFHLPPASCRSSTFSRSILFPHLQTPNGLTSSPYRKVESVSSMSSSDSSMINKISNTARSASTVEDSSPETSSSTVFTSSSRLPLFPSFLAEGDSTAYFAAGLSTRNVFRILLLLQEGNDPRFLPLYLYLRHIFTLPDKTISPFRESYFHGCPLSRDQECRWLLLALTYAAVNAQAIPKEWVWRIAAEALQHLQDGPTQHGGSKLLYSLNESTKRARLDWIEEKEFPYEDENSADHGGREKEENTETAVSSSSSVSAPPASSKSKNALKDRSAHFPTPHILSSIAPDTWRSLNRKWATLRDQYPYTFWISFVSACTDKCNTKEPCRRAPGVIGMNKETTAYYGLKDQQKKSDTIVGWEQLLDLSLFKLLPKTCQQHLHLEQEYSIGSAAKMYRARKNSDEQMDARKRNTDEGIRFLTKRKRPFTVPLSGSLPDAITMFHQTTSSLSFLDCTKFNDSAELLLRLEWQSNWLARSND